MEPQAHEHKWITNSQKTLHACALCGYRESRNSSAEEWKRQVYGNPKLSAPTPAPAPARHDVPSIKIYGLRHLVMPDGSLVMDHGEIVAYDPSRQRAQLGDGSVVDLEVLVASNGLTNAQVFTEKLEQRLPNTFYSPLFLADRITEMATSPTGDAARDAAFARLEKSLEQMGVIASGAAAKANSFAKAAPPLMTVEDALTLILETIKQADDPLVEGGKWLSRITNEITKITQEADPE